jgi:hypothetical protein
MSIHDISVKDIDGKAIKKLGDISKDKKLTLIPIGTLESF